MKRTDNVRCDKLAGTTDNCNCKGNGFVVGLAPENLTRRKERDGWGTRALWARLRILDL